MYYADHKEFVALKNLLIEKGIITFEELEEAVEEFEIKSEEVNRILNQGL